MNKLQTYISTHKKNTILFLLILFGFLFITFFIFHDDILYKDTIIKISDTKNTYLSDKEGYDGRTEPTYQQQITATIQNGKHKGEFVSFQNEYSYSEVASEKLHVGDKLFVKLTAADDGSLKASLLYEKRDSYLFLLLLVFVILLLLCIKKQGFFILLSLLINVGTFFYFLKTNKIDDFLDWIWIIEVLCFCIITLLFVSGFHKKTFGAILSTLFVVGIVTLLYQLTLYHNSDIPYDMLPCMIAYLPLDKLFFISTIFGLLGAVMDVAITMNTAVSELVATTAQLSFRSVISSLLEIGHDIMGTMVSVLFFSYLSGSFPLIVLKVSNDYNFSTIVSVDYIFDIIRFLVGSIGIVLSIPVSGLIAILIFRKGLVHKK